MTRYLVSPKSNQKVFRVCAYGSIGLLLIVLALSQSKWPGLDDRVSHVIGWGAVGLLIVGLVGVFVLIFRHSADKAWRNASFDLTDGQIIQVMQGRAPIALSLTEINFLGESRLGLIVRSGEPTKGFFIPRAVDGFDQLKILLSKYCKVSAIEDRTSFISVLPFALTVCLYAVLFAAKTGLVVLVVGAAALLFQGWSILSMRTVLSKTRSPKLLMSVFIFSWLILLWLVYQRVSSAFNSG
jgi:hypothetical protein